ncbi:hypothetical protein J1614_008441 [Plenodomus biglobosus]|nr:hypothetical protein J1614_008441 [Plenodomus biglobosus]
MIGTALWTGMASERPSLIKSPHGYWLDAYRRDQQLRRGPGSTGGPGIGCLLPAQSSRRQPTLPHPPVEIPTHISPHISPWRIVA